MIAIETERKREKEGSTSELSAYQNCILNKKREKNRKRKKIIAIGSGLWNGYLVSWVTNSLVFQSVVFTYSFLSDSLFFLFQPDPIAIIFFLFMFFSLFLFNMQFWYALSSLVEPSFSLFLSVWIAITLSLGFWPKL